MKTKLVAFVLLGISSLWAASNPFISFIERKAFLYGTIAQMYKEHPEHKEFICPLKADLDSLEVPGFVRINESDFKSLAAVCGENK